MRIKWASLNDLVTKKDWVTRTAELAEMPASSPDREALREALQREGQMEEYKKSMLRARARLNRWFKED
jgi:hypothetical protein